MALRSSPLALALSFATIASMVATTGCGQPASPSDPSVLVPATSASAVVPPASNAPSSPATISAAPTTSATPSATPAPSASTSAPVAPLAAKDDDVFGGLALGLSEAEIVKLLGAPAKKSQVEQEGATGLWVSTWTWPKLGVTLRMAAEAKGRPAKLDSVQLAAPSKLVNPKGIGIGSLRADVVRVFGPRISTENAASMRPGAIVVDSIFGGVIFDVEKDHVVGVFVGAASE
jgi:hypothetical protein